MRDEESLLPDISEMDVSTMTPEQEEELVRDMRREELMADFWSRHQGCQHDYSPCGCYPED